MGPAGVGCTMPHYRIFFLEGRHIKEPAKIISCADDEAATEEARKLLLNGADQSLEVWQGDRRVAVIGPSKSNEATTTR
jgi:hypothetical protein